MIRIVRMAFVPALLLGAGTLLLVTDLVLSLWGWHADTAFLAGQVINDGTHSMERGAAALGVHLLTVVVAPPLLGGGLLYLAWTGLARLWSRRSTA